MSVASVDLLVIGGYLAFLVFIGARLAGKQRSAHDFFLAGRSLGWFVIGLSIIGTNVGANSYVGSAGSAYTLGIAQANFEWIGAIPAMILASMVFIPLYWRAGVYSIAEYLGRRYSPAVRALAAALTSVMNVFGIAIALWAMALMLQTWFGWTPWVGILVAGGVVGLYSVAGGLAAIAYTDALQVTIMFAGGLVLLWVGLEQNDGLAAFAATLTREHPDHLDAFLGGDHPAFPWPGVILGLGLVLSPAYWCMSQDILQRTLAARSEWDGRASMMFAAFAKTCVPLLVVFPGLLALVMHADIEYPDQSLPWVIRNVLPPGLSGLMFVALIAALQSSVDSALNSTSLMLTRDLRHTVFPRANRDHDLMIGRVLSAVLLLVAMAFAPLIAGMGGIYFVVQTLLSLFQGPMLALLVMGAFTRTATPLAGLVALATGVPLAGALTWMDWNMLYVAFVTFLYALMAITVVSRVSPPHPAERLEGLTWTR